MKKLCTFIILMLIVKTAPFSAVIIETETPPYIVTISDICGWAHITTDKPVSGALYANGQFISLISVEPESSFTKHDLIIHDHIFTCDNQNLSTAILILQILTNTRTPGRSR